MWCIWYCLTAQLCTSFPYSNHSVGPDPVIWRRDWFRDSQYLLNLNLSIFIASISFACFLIGVAIGLPSFPERFYAVYMYMTPHLAAKCVIIFLEFKPYFQASSGYFLLLIVRKPNYLSRVFIDQIYPRQPKEDSPATNFIQIAHQSSESWVFISLMFL